MDFRHEVCGPERLSEIAADALLVVVANDTTDERLGGPLGGLVADALKSGDFECKAGRALYLHRPAGL